MEDVIKKIANIEYDLFVANSHAIAIQQSDGRYITKYAHYDSSLIENMIKNYGSAGCYQQSYGNGKMKWVCLDFDCKNKDADEDQISCLYRIIRKDLLDYLDELNITYLCEFSGRRGIHIWLIFDSPIHKKEGYWIVKKLSGKVKIDESIYGVDLFPQTDSYKGNRVGKQVKFPLSTHKSGKKSYFFYDEYTAQENFNLDFYENQLTILKEYKRNNISEVLEILELENSHPISLKYKTYVLEDNFDINVETVIQILSETKVYREIFSRLDNGFLTNKDWYVLLGTLFPLKNTDLIKAILSKSLQYDENITDKKISLLKDHYQPATFEYLYSIYDLDVEEGIDVNESGFEFLANKLHLNYCLEYNKHNNELKLLNDIETTIYKECNYMLDNDENLEVNEWLKINHLNKFDIQQLKNKYDKIISTDDEIPLKKFYVYQRKESDDKNRNMVVLNMEERILTTQLVLEIAYRHCRLLKSYSYNVSFLSDTNLFYNWYTSWGNYIDKIKTYIEIPFFGDWGVITLDLKNYFDSIDFLGLYNSLSDGFSSKDRKIMEKLINYNERLMRKVRSDNSRFGIPQGPAYARVVAELFLNRILEQLPEKKNTNKKQYELFRYVDDIVIFYQDSVDPNILMNDIQQLFKKYSLELNEEKTYIYGKIKNLSNEDLETILRKDRFNYDFQYSETDYLRSDYEKQRLFIECLNDKFKIDDVSYLFGYKTDVYYTKEYFYKYAVNIFSSEYGRGNTFKKFYNYLFADDELLQYTLDNNLFHLIKLNSLNFKNCISCLYLNIYNHSLEKSCIVEICENFLLDLNLDGIDESERLVIKSIERWSGLDHGNKQNTKCIERN